ncbi:Ppx/GppA phosphatase family protein [Limoniibacter endophyticus]|uniref:Exopolyphosphatase n=1 Tax=Limoniibacter endophyticus TaxID=1565040 RepID=A0A8J3DP42_9HYPH|nr:Ppx/GppA phosphatase family protein [Limoniibacter endophyticus]GHC68008.1 exopolyphosphatase [Limoniibacter endophyticus]
MTDSDIRAERPTVGGPADRDANAKATDRPARRRKANRRSSSRKKASEKQPRHPGTPQKAQSGHEDGPPKAEFRKPRKRKRRGRGRVFARDGEQTAAAGSGQQAKATTRKHAEAVTFSAAAGSEATNDAFAALDLGTNNCRLLIAVPSKPGRFRVVDAFSRIVRLGEGLSASGRLSEAAMDRAVEALKACAGKLQGRSIKRQRLIATEACRAAENGAEFLQRVRSETGLDLEIIDRGTEARLAVAGCSPLVTRDTDGVVLFDIGGGSSEIALVDLSRRRSGRLADHIVSWTSLPVGVVTLAERFGGRDVTPEIFQAMVDDVLGHLARFKGKDRLAHLIKGKNFHLLGTSGTVTTIAGIHLGLARYDRRRVDGLWMENRDVDAMIETLLGWDFEARRQNACIGNDRADLVLAGCAILEAIRQTWPSERLRVADRGLREGILTELMADSGAWRRGGSRQKRPAHEKAR